MRLGRRPHCGGGAAVLHACNSALHGLFVGRTIGKARRGLGAGWAAGRCLRRICCSLLKKRRTAEASTRGWSRLMVRTRLSTSKNGEIWLGSCTANKGTFSKRASGLEMACFKYLTNHVGQKTRLVTASVEQQCNFTSGAAKFHDQPPQVDWEPSALYLSNKPAPYPPVYSSSQTPFNKGDDAGFSGKIQSRYQATYPRNKKRADFNRSGCAAPSAREPR